mmetsp:Transcript_120657/g.240258  ORF Transcript_120657/g.240258 Transcript_120657/m.240258 type:complete len:294 (-) Transcript_120657:112-993(-)|eukprot:CAMPEP_0172660382 /NCGR_PEP_ID=MMETSP1074-20121228/4039_1 /TAXON_ID=2916 /ORGANISM="Ceratium fusus, Strain PA161109" /LENGTH=293 /DNA_ID=CAMNT_0013475999 /DNA_START=54 /DNA_END=935 /DNA_ORIENTATION=+
MPALWRAGAGALFALAASSNPSSGTSSPSVSAALAASAEDSNQTEEEQQLQTEVSRLQQEVRHEQVRAAAAKHSYENATNTLKELDLQLEAVHSELVNASHQAALAKKEAANAEAELEALRNRTHQEPGPVLVWFRDLPFQRSLAVTIGFIGLLTIVGPSTFTRPSLAIAASTAAGLMLGGCVDYFVKAMEEGVSWFACMSDLVEGTGLFSGYMAWFVLFALGIVRYLGGFECALWASVDEVDVDGCGGMMASRNILSRPLLAQEGTTENGNNSRDPPAAPVAGSSAAIRDGV